MSTPTAPRHTTTPSAPLMSAPSVAPVPFGLQVLLWVGVVMTLASFVATVALLVVYFVGTAQLPALFWLALFAFPIGFTLILLYLVIAALRRRRQA
ncbi:hypothetical protein [Citricoccus sp. NR2]|uniref:hypothetical protein n=1 Tax=Citricoccus sp. NR2 TaxID=3004095 RepID=UPI0022DD106C|nr:hypothetical protein [Citricoccus sp. NR2]WBL19110.1 hypothetical protein O1A05_15470 [Citricoccus sp. NR2]